MSMDYALCKELKDAGFPIRISYGIEGSHPANGFIEDGIDYYFPTLSELIEACDELYILTHEKHRWDAQNNGRPIRVYASGPTPEIAVAKLWLALNRK